MKFRMIALDLDGTLLRDDKTISEESVAILKKCREGGIKIVFATARGARVLTNEFIPLNLFDGFVRMSGAEAFAGEIKVYCKYVSTMKIRDLLVFANKAGIKISVESNGWHYANFDVNEIWEGACYEIANFNTLNIEADKLTAFPQTIMESELLRNNIPKGFHVMPIRDNFTLVLHEDAEKSKAVPALAEYWKILNSDIVAFGDDLSDFNLIKNCGVGVAMGNAIDKVKEVADCVCDTNDNDGVAKWLEKNLLSMP